MSELKRLTWKYFWKRKKEEVEDFFEEIVWFFEEAWGVFVFIMIILGGFFQIGWVINEGTGLPESKKLAIVGLCMIGVWILIGIIALIVVFCRWIKSNWRLAIGDAESELKKRGGE